MDPATTNHPTGLVPMLRAVGSCLVAVAMLLGAYGWLRAG